MATVTSYGAAQTVTGSCHLVKIGSIRILVDCGMFQGDSGSLSNYEPFGFDPKSIHYLILTHAHLDHIGRVAKLVKEGFDGQIIATKPTHDIAKIMLLDSAGILDEEYRTLKRKARRHGDEAKVLEPLYTEEHVKEVFAKKWHTLNYFTRHKLHQHITVTLANAGHIMGSAIAVIDYHEENTPKRIVFSGDIGSPRRLIIDSPDTLDETDTLFIESTYGDRDHKPLKESVEEFKQAVITTLKRNGNVLIPSFALERTQEILWLLHKMFEKKELPECRVFLDSPLAIKATKLYKKFPVHLSEELEWESYEGKDPFAFKWLEATSARDDSIAINKTKQRAIIIAGSGMCNGGRIMHHLKHRLWNPKNSVIFAGYQANGTLGRRIVDGEEYVRVYGEEIVVRAEIHTINGFSAHADQSDLIEWIGHFKRLDQLCLVHGEVEKMKIFSKAIKTKLGREAHIMERGIPVTV